MVHRAGRDRPTRPADDGHVGTRKRKMLLNHTASWASSCGMPRQWYAAVMR